MSGNINYRKPGQSLPLLALMLVVLIGIIGLSVDVGNAHGQQRRMQNVANAGALAGMNAVVRFQTNQDVCTSVQRTMAANRVGSSAPEYTYRVDYVYDYGSVQMVCSWDGRSLQYARELPMTQTRPANIKRVQVTITEDVSTYFARVVGRDILTVNANGNACLGGYGPQVYPVGVPLSLRKTAGNNQGQQQPYHRIFYQNGAEMPMGHADWGNWDKMMGMTIFLPVSNDPAMSGTHISWLDWDAGSSNANELDAALAYPGTMQNGFKEATPADPALPNVLPLNEFQLGDWIEGKTGVVASASDDLYNLMVPPGLSEPRDLILPIYDIGDGTGSNSAFHITQMGWFRIVGFDLSQQYGITPPSPLLYNKYLMLQYMGGAAGSPQECASEAPDITSSPKRFNISGLTKANTVFSKDVWGSTSFDILLVMDVSTSMRKDWNDQSSSPHTARAEDAKRALLGFLRSYRVEDDPTARISYVSFGGEGNNAVVTEQNWTTACANPASGCGGDANKWQTIQNRITNMTFRKGTPGPMAFERVEQLLRDKRTPPPGKGYSQVVIFATDGIFNVCGAERGLENCPYGTQVGGTVEQNLVSGRPIWQAQRVAERIKATTGAQIFMVTLVPNCRTADPEEGCFITTGLPEMSSGTGYYYNARNGAGLVQMYQEIQGKMGGLVCMPGEKMANADGARMVLTQPNNPTFVKTTTAGSDGQWHFTGLEAGQYVVRVDPAYSVKSPEDGEYRTYSRLRNALNLNEETQASIYINPQYPNGATVYSEVHLSLPIGTDEAPLNGCTTGTASP